MTTQLVDWTTVSYSHYFNASNRTTEPKINVDCKFFEFVSWGLVGGVFCLFGLVGNALSLAAFGRERRTPSTTLLQCLSVSDFTLLASVLATDAIPYLCSYTAVCTNPWSSWPYVRYVWLLTPISHMLSVWLVVLVSINRFWAVCRAYEMSRVWTNERTLVYVALVAVFVLAFTVPRCLEYHITSVYNSAKNTTLLKEQRTVLGESPEYKMIYKTVLTSLFVFLVPTLTLITLTCFILHTLYVNRKKLAQSRTAKATGDISVVLLLVVILTTVCQTPLAVFQMVRLMTRGTCGSPLYYLDNVSKVLVNVNSSCNFILYVVFCSRFRRLLAATACCCCLSPKMPMESTEMETIVRSTTSR